MFLSSLSFYNTGGSFSLLHTSIVDLQGPVRLESLPCSVRGWKPPRGWSKPFANTEPVGRPRTWGARGRRGSSPRSPGLCSSRNISFSHLKNQDNHSTGRYYYVSIKGDNIYKVLNAVTGVSQLVSVGLDF